MLVQPTSYVGRPPTAEYLDIVCTLALIQLGSEDRITSCHPHGTVGSLTADYDALCSRQLLACYRLYNDRQDSQPTADYTLVSFSLKCESCDVRTSLGSNLNLPRAPFAAALAANELRQRRPTISSISSLDTRLLVGK
jgi:hypothetical protein